MIHCRNGKKEKKNVACCLASQYSFSSFSSYFIYTFFSFTKYTNYLNFPIANHFCVLDEVCSTEISQNKHRNKYFIITKIMFQETNGQIQSLLNL